MTAIDTLTDAFSSPDTVKWTFPGSVAVTGGQLNVPVTSTYVSPYSNSGYDLTGSAAYVELAQTPNLGTGTTSAGLSLGPDGSNSESIHYAGGLLLMRETVAGVNDDTTLTFDTVNHKWFRIRESGGTIFWDTSPDGVTWTNRRSKAAGVTVTNVGVVFFVGYYGTESSPGTAIFDNFNRVDGTSNAAFFAMF